jgi:hypothetical protein
MHLQTIGEAGERGTEAPPPPCPLDLALETLLATGGDDRLTLDGATGQNRYGCTPWPRPEIINFGSCTASSPSAPAFAHVRKTHQALMADAVNRGAGPAIAAATTATEQALLDYFQVADLAAAILTASGTDAALIVTSLFAAEHPDCGFTSVLVSPSETGSGVPLAVQGRHFAAVAADGSSVTKGEALHGLATAPVLATIALRDATGQPRGQADIAADCEALITGALATGRVVLHAIDGSKTGLAAPDRPALLRLAKRFGARLDIVVDACQARIEPALVRWYLSKGFPVLVTGSKFFTAPGFCGAVLFPRARLARIAAACGVAQGFAAAGGVAQGLAPYTSREGGLGSRRCPGLLLRWAAALYEMGEFARLGPDEVGRRLDRIEALVHQALARDARLHLVDAPRPPGMGWSDRRSVFTFRVRTGSGWMNPATLRELYLQLQRDLPDTTVGEAAARCQIGQPVELGHADLGGLRIALSARQVAGDDDLGAALGCVVGRLGRLLDDWEARQGLIFCKTEAKNSYSAVAD